MRQQSVQTNDDANLVSLSLPMDATFHLVHLFAFNESCSIRLIISQFIWDLFEYYGVRIFLLFF